MAAFTYGIYSFSFSGVNLVSIKYTVQDHNYCSQTSLSMFNIFELQAQICDYLKTKMKSAN